jgi:hypothetical protein
MRRGEDNSSPRTGLAGAGTAGIAIRINRVQSLHSLLHSGFALPPLLNFSGDVHRFVVEGDDGRYESVQEAASGQKPVVPLEPRVPFSTARCRPRLSPISLASRSSVSWNTICRTNSSD